VEEEENQDGWGPPWSGFEIKEWNKSRMKDCGRFINSIEQLC
jgi:hypothetical protein